jgi:hypothetical protein
MKMGATGSSENLVCIDQITGHYTPEDGNFHTRHLDNIISLDVLNFLNVVPSRTVDR